MLVHSLVGALYLPELKWLTCLGASTTEIYSTSSATASNNWSLSIIEAACDEGWSLRWSLCLESWPKVVIILVLHPSRWQSIACISFVRWWWSRISHTATYCLLTGVYTSALARLWLCQLICGLNHSMLSKVLMLLIWWSAFNRVLKELLVGLSIGVWKVTKAGRSECLSFGIDHLPPQLIIYYLSEVLLLHVRWSVSQRNLLVRNHLHMVNLIIKRLLHR